MTRLAALCCVVGFFFLGFVSLITGGPRSHAIGGAESPPAETGKSLYDKTEQKIFAAWKEHEAQRTEKSLKSLLETVRSAAGDERLDPMARKIWLDYYNLVAGLTSNAKPPPSSAPKPAEAVPSVPSVPMPPRGETSSQGSLTEPGTCLRGLEGVFITVEKPPPAIERLGLSGKSLHDDVEARLRAAGIRVLTREEFLESQNGPTLCVKMRVLEIENEPSLLYSFTVSVSELVYILRHPEARLVAATTWTSDGAPAMTPGSNVRDMRETLSDQVDQFVDAYRTANPKSVK